MAEWERTRIVAVVAAMTLAGGGVAAAKERAAKGERRGMVDPAAVGALEEMGKYLRGLKVFEVRAEVTDEDVMTDGQKIQRSATVELLASRPNRLRAEVESDRHQRLFLYDGKTMTLVAERLGYYASVPAPRTIRELADRLEERHGFSLPLSDLFRWGEAQAASLTSAIDVGPSVVDGTTCEHYAFAQKDVDWQVWIQKGDFPLPRKLVITTKSDPARPTHTAVYTWNLAPSFNEAAFSYEPPRGAQRIKMAEAAPAVSVDKKKRQRLGGMP
jgi:hypothetical protein